MKNLILVILAVLCFTVAAVAQTPVYSYQTLAVPTTLTAGATTNVDLVMDVRHQGTVAFMFTFKIGNTGTNNVQQLQFYRSLDGTTYDTVGFTVAAASAGSTVVTTITNLPTLGAGFIKLHSWINNETNAQSMAAAYAINTAAIKP